MQNKFFKRLIALTLMGCLVLGAVPSVAFSDVTEPAAALEEGAQADASTLEASSYTITIDETTGGTVTADKYTAAKLDTVTLTVVPDDGYVLDTLTVYYDGYEVKHVVETTPGANNTRTFTMPDSNVAVTATFKQDKVTYTVTTDNAAITADKESYEAGETVTLTNALPMGTVLTWLSASYDNNGTTTAVALDSNTLTFTMPEGDVTVTAETVEGCCIDVVTVNAPAGCTITPFNNVSTAYGGRYYAAGDIITFMPQNYGDCDYSASAVDAQSNDVPVTGGGSMGIIIQGMPSSDVTLTMTFTATRADPSYTITIPPSVSLNDAQGMTITASQVQNLNGQAINVAVTSANGGRLKNGANEIGYSFARSLSFTENGSQSLVLTLADAAGKPAGTYADTLSFSVSLSSTTAGE